MNVLEEFHRDEQRVLDRLVDGELGQQERRQLLAALDDEPGAWRRCALAFLEAQTWRWQLSQLATEPIVVQESSGRTAGSTPAAGRGIGLWSHWLAIAAGLVVAFGLGTKFQTEGVLPPNPSSNPTSSSIAQVGEGASNAEAFDPADELSDVTPETLTLALAGEPSDPFELQVVQASEDDEDFAADQASAMPADFLLELQQAGLEVTSQKQYWPIDLSDGRRLILPVEQVEIRNAEFVKYQ